MTTTLSEGVIVPDAGDVNWAGKLEVNWNLLNGALANLSGNVKLDRDNTWTGEQSFTLPIVGSITGTASKAIADEDGTSIKTGYVNVAGNQTVSGQKTWSGNQFFTSAVYHKSTTYEIGNIPASNIVTNIYLADKNNVYTGFVRSVIYSSGRTATEIRAKNAFKNGVLDPTGSDISSNLNVEVQPNGTKTIYWDGLIRNDVTPYTTNNNSLGSSTNQWSSVYAQTYYYNGTQWGLDKANTWTGANTFSAGILTTMVEASPGNTGLVIRSTDQTWEGGARIFLYSNTQTGQTNGSIYVDVDHGDNGNTKTGLTLVPNAFHPMGGTVNTTYGVSLGTATYQWAKVYSEQYFYNGTAWGLDKENVWSANQTILKGSEALYVLKRSDLKLGDAIPQATQALGTFAFTGSDGANVGIVTLRDNSNGDTSLIILARQKYNSNGARDPAGIQYETRMDIGIDSSRNHYIRPNSNGDVNLGTSTNKWKSLNGINPGALSLPSDGSNGVEIDRTNWVYDGVTSNKYTPVVDGWLLIRCTDAAGNFIFAASDGKVVSTSGTGLITSVVFGLNVLLPVRANKECDIRINCSGSKTAYFYPCLGNV